MVLAAAPSTWETVSLIASVVSIALAFFAIWQATTFYKWSSQASKDSERAADAVGESVRKLEDLFNRLYNDTFGMMRDTVSDMRKHVWPSQEQSEKPQAEKALAEVERRAKDNVSLLREEVMEELRELVEAVGSTTTQVTTLEDSLASVLDRAIDGSRVAEDDAREATARSRLDAAIRRLKGRGRKTVDADTILGPLFEELEVPDVHRAIFALRDEGIVEFEGDPPMVSGPDVNITLT